MITVINGRVSLTVFSSYLEVQNMYWQGIYTFIESAIIGGIAKLRLYLVCMWGSVVKLCNYNLYMSARVFADLDEWHSQVSILVGGIKEEGGSS